MAKSLQEIRVHVDRFTDSCRRLFFALDRWCDGFGVGPGPKDVDWEFIRTLEVHEINAAFLSVGQSIEILLKECADLESGKYQTIIKSAATISKWAFEESKTGPFDEEQFGGYPTTMSGSCQESHLRKAVGLLSIFADLMELQEMHVSRREVLQVLLENGPTNGQEIAKLATGADPQGSFRDMLADMVKEDLLHSGKGRYSTGYRLSDRGMQLAQLSGQLKDF